MAEVIINNVKVTLIRRYNQRGPWRNEYYFRGNWGWELHILKILWELYCHIIFCLVKGNWNTLQKC